ncbi:hypothetical protein BJ508DRAFT_308363 [Ascobolus immersus RN42]|uniref:F-box domain-containing protein n=1 Tax=Ascobolus immersus RN42 TaxID=1160509 RepID=A0A3N4I010_ASCIM|nr:hypothetical protein BJ508DRAFT_308363 [Ascobolus immersus RN42]
MDSKSPYAPPQEMQTPQTSLTGKLNEHEPPVPKHSFLLRLPTELRLCIYEYSSALGLLQLASTCSITRAEIHAHPSIIKTSFGYWPRDPTKPTVELTIRNIGELDASNLKDYGLVCRLRAGWNVRDMTKFWSWCWCSGDGGVYARTKRNGEGSVFHALVVARPSAKFSQTWRAAPKFIVGFLKKLLICVSSWIYHGALSLLQLASSCSTLRHEIHASPTIFRSSFGYWPDERIAAATSSELTIKHIGKLNGIEEEYYGTLSIKRLHLEKALTGSGNIPGVLVMKSEDNQGTGCTYHDDVCSTVTSWYHNDIMETDPNPGISPQESNRNHSSLSTNPPSPCPTPPPSSVSPLSSASASTRTSPPIPSSYSPQPATPRAPSSIPTPPSSVALSGTGTVLKPHQLSQSRTYVSWTVSRMLSSSIKGVSGAGETPGKKLGRRSRSRERRRSYRGGIVKRS